jgi:hypothetical protein
MSFVLASKNKQFSIFKSGEDGKPTGKSLGLYPSREEVDKQLLILGATPDEIKNVKCYDDGTYVYVPYGVTTLKDALAAQDAQEDAQEIQQLGLMYTQIVNNILGSPDVGDKAKAITDLADEFATELKSAASPDDAGEDDTEKSLKTFDDGVPVSWLTEWANATI